MDQWLCRSHLTQRAHGSFDVRIGLCSIRHAFHPCVFSLPFKNAVSVNPGIRPAKTKEETTLRVRYRLLRGAIIAATRCASLRRYNPDQVRRLVTDQSVTLSARLPGRPLRILFLCEATIIPSPGSVKRHQRPASAFYADEDSVGTWPLWSREGERGGKSYCAGEPRRSGRFAPNAFIATSAMRQSTRLQTRSPPPLAQSAALLQQVEVERGLQMRGELVVLSRTSKGASGNICSPGSTVAPERGSIRCRTSPSSKLDSPHFGDGKHPAPRVLHHGHRAPLRRRVARAFTQRVEHVPRADASEGTAKTWCSLARDMSWGDVPGGLRGA